MRRLLALTSAALALLVITALSITPITLHAAEPAAHHGRNVVIWISVDGMRGDYVKRTAAPFLTRMTKEGAYTTQLLPVTPSITFASHSSEMTGVSVNGHGIPHNTLYDPESHQAIGFPSEQKWLLAEPLWTTAARQGVRSAVIQWPLSNAQTGDLAAAYFMPKYDNKISDADSLSLMLDKWESDKDPNPVRLMIGYVHNVDTIGHLAGPDSPAITEALTKVDSTLSATYDRAVKDFKTTMQQGDQLYFLVSTDHGMMTVTDFVSPEKLLAAPNRPEVVVTTSGPVADVYVDQIKDPTERESVIAAMLAEVTKYPFAKAWRRSDVPAEWEYSHPTRVGDIVVMLDNGYTFRKIGAVHLAIKFVPGGTNGMHGYPVATCPEMMGFTAVLRYPDPIGGKDLGKVDSRSLHATVAHWLGIKPANGALTKTMEVD